MLYIYKYIFSSFTQLWCFSTNCPKSSLTSLNRINGLFKMHTTSPAAQHLLRLTLWELDMDLVTAFNRTVKRRVTVCSETVICPDETHSEYWFTDGERTAPDWKFPDKWQRHLGFESLLISCCPLLAPSFPPFLKASDCQFLSYFITICTTLWLSRLLFNKRFPPWWTVIS